MNLIEFLRTAKIEDLGLPAQIIQKLRDQNLIKFQKVYASVQSFKMIGKCTISGMTDEEMQILSQKYTDLMVANGLMKPKNPPVPAATKTISSSPTAVDHRKATNKVRPASTRSRQSTGEKQSDADEPTQPLKRNTPAENLSPHPLAIWESRLAPELRKVELVGEIPISKEELADITQHFSRLFYNHCSDEVLNFISRNYPVTFLVFMVGQGIYGYNNGDFWSSYEQVLHHPIDSIAFGRLFEKLIKRFNKPQFRDLQDYATFFL